jgi:two-component system, OmpR family, sensor kinase
MTRRLIVAIVGMVAGALLLAGVTTLVLVRFAARSETRDELEEQVAALAPLFVDVARVDRVTGDAARPVRPFLEALRRALRLQGFETITLDTTGTLVSGQAPAGVSFDPSDVAALARGELVSGTNGDLVFAAARLGRVTQRRPGSDGVAVLAATRRADSGLALGGRWFVLACAITLVAAVALAATLGRRLTRPVRAAEAAARRVAAGDLDVRVPVPGGDDELAMLATSLNTMTEELARARGAERQFLLSVSHELRTPLTSIQGFAEAIHDGAAADHDHAAGVIAAEARRLERLVHDLLDLARLDARSFSLDVRETDAGEVARHTAEGFRPAAETAGVLLDVAVDGDAPATLVHADPERLGQVVANLVENALKYAGSRIRVGAASHDGRAVVWVDDDGPGIADADLPRVFDRLFTTGRPAARQAGTGLGLAIVRELVEAMGGTVRAERLDGGGTRMVVTLRAVAPNVPPN